MFWKRPDTPTVHVGTGVEGVKLTQATLNDRRQRANPIKTPKQKRLDQQVAEERQGIKRFTP